MEREKADETEEWRPWPRDPTVQVSNLGRVKSRFGRVLSADRRKWTVNVGMGVLVRVKLLVWQTWVADEDVQLRNRDGDKRNCSVDNLELWPGTDGQREELSKIKPEDIGECVRMYRAGQSMRDIGARFGCTDMTVHNAFKRAGLIPKDIRRHRKVAKLKAASDGAGRHISAAIPLLEAGLHIGEVAAVLRVSNSTISMAIAQAGVSVYAMRRRLKEDRDGPIAAALGIPMGSVTSKRRTLAAYGMTAEEYVALKERQSNKCAACGRPLGPERTGGNLAGTAWPVVDHCHRTDDKRGSVRGILHASCNSMLGVAREDRTVFLRLAKYLDSTKSDRPMSPAPQTAALPGIH